MDAPNGRDITDHYDCLREIVREWGVDPFFVTVTGVDLYGFPSADSDFDLRGAFMLPLEEIIGIKKPKDTITRLTLERGLDVDLVVHDIGKFVQMLAQGNGSILEETLSPLVMMGHETLLPLAELAAGCITRKLFLHYNGFSRHQIAKFWEKEPRHYKTLLYIYRILMTGIHALETGELESNLVHLNQRFGLPFIPDLIAAKLKEFSVIEDADWDLHRQAIQRLPHDVPVRADHHHNLCQSRRAYCCGHVPEHGRGIDRQELLGLAHSG